MNISLSKILAVLFLAYCPLVTFAHEGVDKTAAQVKATPQVQVIALSETQIHQLKSEREKQKAELAKINAKHEQVIESILKSDD